MIGTAQTLESVAIPVAQPRSNERYVLVLAERPSVYGSAFLVVGVAIRVDEVTLRALLSLHRPASAWPIKNSLARLAA